MTDHTNNEITLLDKKRLTKLLPLSDIYGTDRVKAKNGARYHTSAVHKYYIQDYPHI